jgi:HD-GYP domain-containing protein (c-di-GMP phosphodiesterase class II)/HAMP domain-containing protein
MRSFKPKTLYTTLSFLMMGLVALVYGVLAAHERWRSEALMLQQAGEAARRISVEAAAAVESELRPARVSVALLAASWPAARDAQSLTELAVVLRSNASLSSVYVGSTDGAFVQLRRLDDTTRRLLGAPAGAVYALQTQGRARGASHGRICFHDDALRELAQVACAGYDAGFDPRTRPWFGLARAAAEGTVVQSAPYRFFTTAEPGVTLAQARGDVVVGVDVGLQALGAMLARPQISDSAQLLIATPGGELLAQARPSAAALQGDGEALPRVSDAASPVMQALWARRDAAGQLAPVQHIDGREWVSHALALQAFQIQSRTHGLYLSLGLMLLLALLVPLLAGRVAKPLYRLSRQAQAIQRFEFDEPEPRRSLIREVDQLGQAMSGMKQSLRRFLDISGALSAERDVDTLLDIILRETIAITGASGGSVHLLSADGRMLNPALTRYRGVKVAQADGCVSWAVDEADSLGASVQALRADDAVEVELNRDDPRHAAAYAAVFAGLNTPRLRLLALPLKNRDHDVIGTLTLSFPIPPVGRPMTLGAGHIALVRALSGTAAVALDNQLLLRTRKELMESFIKLVAGAVDAKSPYTAGHCQRVPELTRLIAQAACNATEGAYAGFSMDAGEWEALHVASWLHDCGKVTTPEYVVDKATKLETLYNRIHEIRTRFEVLKRDALIDALQAELGEAGSARARAAAAPAQAELDSDYAFVAHANLGAESLRPESRERLQRIGERRWQRTLDDTLGISAEEARGQPQPRPSLPADETLLQDRPDHIVARPEGDVLDEGNALGVRMKQPTHLYHRGELYNLGVSRGTLTEEERYKVNEHVVQTMRMLHELPFPKHLRNVPEIAGGHHERMDGKGYPRGLLGSQMSPQARMMAVADVFEALTADDRPYKPGKRLSEALVIMQRMTRGGHLDPDLFTLFLRSGSCLDYARRFMPARLVDVSEVSVYEP